MSTPFEMTREELQAIHEKYREVKHDINNTLAVIMALSELAQRNPAHYEKLAKAVLTRGPDVMRIIPRYLHHHYLSSGSRDCAT